MISDGGGDDGGIVVCGLLLDDRGDNAVVVFVEMAYGFVKKNEPEGLT